MSSAKRRPCFSPGTSSPETDDVIARYEARLKECGTNPDLATWHVLVVRNLLENFLPEIGYTLNRGKRPKRRSRIGS